MEVLLTIIKAFTDDEEKVDEALEHVDRPDRDSYRVIEVLLRNDL